MPANYDHAVRLAFERWKGRCVICRHMIPPAAVAGVLAGDGSVRPAHPECAGRAVTGPQVAAPEGAQALNHAPAGA